MQVFSCFLSGVGALETSLQRPGARVELLLSLSKFRIKVNLTQFDGILISTLLI